MKEETKKWLSLILIDVISERVRQYDQGLLLPEELQVLREMCDEINKEIGLKQFLPLQLGEVRL